MGYSLSFEWPLLIPSLLLPQMEQRPYHLVSVLVQLFEALTDEQQQQQQQLSAAQRRVVREECLDHVAEYLTELSASADPSAGLLTAKLSGCQAKLERWLL